MSRMRLFVLAFSAMFVWFWFPNYIFQALQVTNWMSWIAPNNRNLNTITGSVNGLGYNPFPSFDWNPLLFDDQDPLMVPFFNTVNKFIGMFVSGFIAMGMWYSNVWNTGYLPINTNRVFDNTATRYVVANAIDDRGIFDPVKYEAYSPAYLGAANLMVYGFFFAVYSSTISYAYLYHR